MRTASVSELKAKLSQYLREVRRGGEVQVLDRGVPVARLVSIRGSNREDAGRVARLVSAGLLRAGTGDASFLLRLDPLKAPKADLSGALEEERQGSV